MSNIDNLKPVRSKEEARERGRNGGIKSGEVRKQKKFMSQIYAEFLEKHHDVITKDGTKRKLEGQELLNSVISKVLSRSDSSSVSMMKEIREATEGTKATLNHSGDMSITINRHPVKAETKLTDD